MVCSDCADRCLSCVELSNLRTLLRFYLEEESSDPRDAVVGVSLHAKNGWKTALSTQNLREP